MEVLVPIVIVTIGIGLLLVFLRRPTVVRPPDNAAATKPDPAKLATTREDPLNELPDDLNLDMSVGGKRLTLKGNKKIGWTLTRGQHQTTVSPEFMRRVVIKEGADPLSNDLLAGLTPGSFPGDAPPEAQLHYPGSSVVLNSFETQRASRGASESGDVYKTTLATEADRAQVQAWYRDWLLSHDWQVSPTTGTPAGSSEEYVRASDHFRLAVADPATLAPILAMPIPEGTKTIYEVEYSTAATQPPAS